MLTEKDVIDYILSLTADQPDDNVIVPPGSDCFAFKPSVEGSLLVTKDVLVDGIHFRRSWAAPEVLGRRAVLVNFSDIAAGGGRPLFVFFGLGLPEGIEADMVFRLIDGVYAACRDYGALLSGGDTVAAAELFLSVTVIGTARYPLKRYPARPGEKIFLTGEIGASYCGYFLLEQAGEKGDCVERFLLPEPHVRQGEAVARLGARVCEDVSDGLARDLGNICVESGVGAVIYEEKLPVCPELVGLAEKYGFDAVEKAVSFGDDYVLVFTADEKLSSKLKGVDFPVYEIGEVVSEPGVRLRRSDGSMMELDQGYLHRF